MKRTTMVMTAFLVAWMVALPIGWAQTDKEHAEVAQALKNVTLPLEKGLSASTASTSRLSTTTDFRTCRGSSTCISGPPTTR